MEKFHHPHAQIEKHRSAVDIAGHFPRRTLEDGLHVDHIAVVDESGELGGESLLSGAKPNRSLRL